MANKIDSLPKGWTVERIQTWVKNQIDSKIDPKITYNICLTSAKEATGVGKVLEILERIKKDFP